MHSSVVYSTSLIRSLSLEIKVPHQSIEVAFNPLVVGCGFHLLGEVCYYSEVQPHPRLKALLI